MQRVTNHSAAGPSNRHQGGVMKHRRLLWTGVIAGAFAAFIVNAVLAHASNSSPATEEFHHTYPITADGRINLQNINGDVHIATWDQNQVKVDAIKRAYDEEGLKEEEIRIEASADSI